MNMFDELDPDVFYKGHQFDYKELDRYLPVRESVTTRLLEDCVVRRNTETRKSSIKGSFRSVPRLGLSL